MVYQQSLEPQRGLHPIDAALYFHKSTTLGSDFTTAPAAKYAFVLQHSIHVEGMDHFIYRMQFNRAYLN